MDPGRPQGRSVGLESHDSHACPAINVHVFGLAECSLGSVPHHTHRLLCEATGEVLGEWTNDDPVFRDPCNQLQPRTSQASSAA